MKKLEKVYFAPVVEEYELMVEGTVLSGSDDDQIIGGEIVGGDVWG